MKTWIRTKIIGTGAESDPRIPYVSNQGVSTSMLDFGDGTCLCRVAGTPVQIGTILADSEITQATDDEARSFIKSEHPNSDLENLDVPDPEVDSIAEARGLDPRIRTDIQVPGRGDRVLQAQENYLMMQICANLGLTKDYWDDEAAKSEKWVDGHEIEDYVLDGVQEAHEFVLSRIRTHT